MLFPGGVSQKKGTHQFIEATYTTCTVQWVQEARTRHLLVVVGLQQRLRQLERVAESDEGADVVAGGRAPVGVAAGGLQRRTGGHHGQG